MTNRLSPWYDHTVVIAFFTVLTYYCCNVAFLYYIWYLNISYLHDHKITISTKRIHLHICVDVWVRRYLCAYIGVIEFSFSCVFVVIVTVIAAIVFVVEFLLSCPFMLNFVVFCRLSEAAVVCFDWLPSIFWEFNTRVGQWFLSTHSHIHKYLYCFRQGWVWEGACGFLNFQCIINVVSIVGSL